MLQKLEEYLLENFKQYLVINKRGLNICGKIIKTAQLF